MGETIQYEMSNGRNYDVTLISIKQTQDCVSCHLSIKNRKSRPILTYKMNPSKDRIQYLGPQHKPGFRPTMFDTNEKEQTKKTGLILTTLKAAPVATGCKFSLYL